MTNFKVLSLCFIFVFISLSVLLSHLFFTQVAAQLPYYRGTTANVSISGWVGKIIVLHNPVDFTPSGTDGLQPATDDNIKQDADALPYITVNTSGTTNINWGLSINASYLVDDRGNLINPANITVNTTCAGDIASPADIRLSTDLQTLCTWDSANPESLTKTDSTDVYFYLDIPAGQYNNTYNATFWLYVNSSDSYANDTWVGTWNITMKVRRYIEIAWSHVPITFSTMSPGTSSNATKGLKAGWPGNVTNGAATNIYLDLYINATNLIATSGDALTAWGGNEAEILTTNITYSNATDEFARAPEDLHLLQKDLPTSSECVETAMLTANWCGIHFKDKETYMNNTDFLNWWNITIDQTQYQGTYRGDVNAKAVDAGYDPTPFELP